MRVPSYITSFFQIYSNSNLVTGSLFNRLKGSDLEPYLQHLLSVSSDHYTFHTHRFILKIALHDSFVYFFYSSFFWQNDVGQRACAARLRDTCQIRELQLNLQPHSYDLIGPPVVDEWVLLNRVPQSVLLSVCPGMLLTLAWC